MDKINWPSTRDSYESDFRAMQEEITRLRNLLQNGSPVVEGTIQHMAMRITELEAVIKSHGIPVKSYSGGVAHYCTGIYDAKGQE